MRRIKTKKDKAQDAAFDALIAQTGHSPEALMGEQGVLAQMTKRLIERVLGAELVHHLKTGRRTTEAVPDEQGQTAEAGGNCRNGFSPQDGARRQRRDAYRRAARPAQQLRAAAGAQVAEEAPRLRGTVAQRR